MTGTAAPGGTVQECSTGKRIEVGCLFRCLELGTGMGNYLGGCQCLIRIFVHSVLESLLLVVLDQMKTRPPIYEEITL